MNEQNTRVTFTGERIMECLYGENPQQRPAGFYSAPQNDHPLSLKKFKLVEGKPLSYNNLCDQDRLLQTMTHVVAAMEINNFIAKFPFIALAVKHGNLCAAAWSSFDSNAALRKMIEFGHRGDIMGGLVMTNFQIRKDDADILAHHLLLPGEERRKVDAVFAPAFEEGAREELRRVKDNCRFCVNPALAEISKESLDSTMRFRYTFGGDFLMQRNYTFVPNLRDPAIVTCRGVVDEEGIAELAFGWAIGSTSNSNTIVLVHDRALVGLGAGQMSRVGAFNLASARCRDAGQTPIGSFVYSDSFFPFDDAPRQIIEAGAKAIFTSEGGIHFADTVKVCEENGVPLLTVLDTVGRGFFGH